jgi:hypothetical protein
MLYYLARELMADPNKVTEDSGTHISHACDALRRWGLCEETLWPYVTSGNTFAVSPPWSAMRRGYVNKIESFYRIVSHGQDRMDGILLHLHSGNPVVFGTAVTKKFMRETEKDTVVEAPQGRFVGRHAMTIVGWLPDHLGGVLVIENSWGERFGDGGFFYASPDYIQSSQAKDIWAIAGGWEDWL